MSTQPLKLNLGSGTSRIDGFINVDYSSECKPDIVMNLEEIPWGFEDNSVSHIVMKHVLEHLGQTPQSFIAIIKELYRICQDGAVIEIVVPHPAHEYFYSDPTHVRPITPMLMKLFDREHNLHCREKGMSNSPLALQHDVNFKFVSSQNRYDRNVLDYLQKQKLKDAAILDLFLNFGRNMIEEIYIQVKAVK